MDFYIYIYIYSRVFFNCSRYWKHHPYLKIFVTIVKNKFNNDLIGLLNQMEVLDNTSDPC